VPKEQRDKSDTHVLAEEVWLVADAMRAEGLEHPPRSVLRNYQNDELESDQETWVRRHLVLCAECTQTLLDFAEEEVVKSGASVNEASSSEVEAPSPSAIAEVVAIPRGTRRPTILLAASIAALVAAGGWGLGLKRHLAAALAPQANVWVADLSSSDADPTRSGTQVRRIVVPESYQRLVLLLNLADHGDYSGYELEASDHEGTLLFRLPSLEPRPEGGFSVELADLSIFAGPIRLEVYGVRPMRTRIGSFWVEIASETPK